jgi:hypothetical protein
MATVLVAGAVACSVALLLAMQRYTYDEWGAILLFPILTAVSLPLLAKVARHETDPRVVQLLYLAFFLKLLATFARYFMVFDLYGGVGDAVRYDRVGGQIGHGWLHIDTTVELRHIPGTGFIDLLTGLVYALIGPTRLGGFLFFSWLAFWGLLLWYRAVRISVPDASPLAYGRLLFLLPSLFFWPSSIGKESFITFALGIGAYGVARALTGRATRGILLLATSAWLIALVRPHMAVLLTIGAFGALVVRRSPERAKTMGPVLKILGVAVMAGLVALFALRAQEFFKVDELSENSVNSVLATTVDRSSQGGSSYAAPGGTLSAAKLPFSLVTVLFRPFPYEAHNVQAFVASLETLFLLGLLFLRFRWLAHAVRRARAQPLIAFAGVYTVAFCLAFSSVGNFGILSRQRVQVLPAFLLLLAVPLPKRRASGGG